LLSLKQVPNRAVQMRMRMKVRNPVRMHVHALSSFLYDRWTLGISGAGYVQRGPAASALGRGSTS